MSEYPKEYKDNKLSSIEMHLYIEEFGFKYNKKGNWENKDGYMFCLQPFKKYAIHKDNVTLFLGKLEYKHELENVLKYIGV